MDNVWFFKILLLFQVESKTDLGLKRHSCAFVSVLEEYTGPWRPGELLILLMILITIILFMLLMSLITLFPCNGSMVG